jgi:hypothetical protein
MYGIRVRTAVCDSEVARRPRVVVRFILIIADVALASDIPVKEHGPNGPYSTQLRGALDDRLELRSGDPEPNQPEDGLHDDDSCRDSSN